LVNKNTTVNEFCVEFFQARLEKFGVSLNLLFVSLALILFSIIPESSAYSPAAKPFGFAAIHNFSSDYPRSISDADSITYYVATNGNNSNPGTIGSPWRTIQYAVDHLNPGDILYVRGGIYLEDVTISRSGTVDLPITISAYPNETPILDGNNYSLPSSTWGAMFKIVAEYIHLSGFEVRYGNWIGVSLNQQHTIVSDMNVHHQKENGFIIIGDHSVVQNSTIWSNCLSNQNGISTRGGWSTGISAARSPNDAVIRGNTVFNNWGEGISTFEANGTTIEDNIVYDNWSSNIYVSDATNVLVQRNLVYGSSNSQITVGGRVGIMMGDEQYSPPSSHITIINNFVYGNRRNFYWWPGVSGGRLDHVLIANNTFANSRRNANFQIDGNVTHINSRIENNIFLQEDSLDIAVAGSTSGLSLSNNLWSKTPPSNLMGVNDVFGDPMLMKTGQTDAGLLSGDWFKLSLSSPAIDHGKFLTEVMDDYFKQTRSIPFDIGAYEQTFIPTHFYFAPLVLN
jgi:parallel beta-helix repeat protein